MLILELILLPLCGALVGWALHWLYSSRRINELEHRVYLAEEAWSIANRRADAAILNRMRTNGVSN